MTVIFTSVIQCFQLVMRLENYFFLLPSIEERGFFSPTKCETERQLMKEGK